MKTTCLSAAMTAAIPPFVTLAAWFRSTGTRLFAVGISLATFTPASGQPAITTQPQSQTNVVGSVVTLSVEATGTPPLFFQWRRQSSNVAGEMNAALVIASLQNSNAGNYTVVITNAQGAITSAIAYVRIVVPPAITTQPTDQIVDVGATATFAVIATGNVPLAYQWRFNDANLAGKTSASLVLANVQLTNAGNYSVVVTNAVGSVTSRVAVLTFTTVHRIEGITANPANTISLKLTGVVPRLFAPYYDIYPLEASTNLADWLPMGTVQRTNASLDALSYLDPDAKDFDKRFYRTPSNFLVTPFPKPSGPYPVGTVSRLLTDPSRSNRYNIPTNSSFMVTFWYPAEDRAGVLPDSYIENNAGLSDVYIYLNGRNPGIVPKFVSQAFPGLPLATNETRYPVVIYSGNTTRRSNTDQALELASHGYVVVAVDHATWLTASVFPNGQVVSGTDPCNATVECWQPTLDNAIKDILFVLDELSRLNTNDVLFAGRLDLERVGAFSRSVTCVPVTEFCRIDARCKAVVLLDAARTLDLSANLTQLGLQKPFLSMNSASPVGPWPPGVLGRPPIPPGSSEWLAPTLALFAKATNDAFWFQIQDAGHVSFQDRGSLISDPSLTADPTPASRAPSQTIRGCMVSFFDKYLKNHDDHLLDNPAAVYTNIINFQRK